MKRIFYSIGLVFAIFFLSCGFFLSYQLTSLRQDEPAGTGERFDGKAGLRQSVFQG